LVFLIYVVIKLAIQRDTTQCTKQQHY